MLLGYSEQFIKLSLNIATSSGDNALLYTLKSPIVPINKLVLFENEPSLTYWVLRAAVFLAGLVA